MQSIDVEAKDLKAGQLIYYFDEHVAETVSVLFDKIIPSDPEGFHYEERLETLLATLTRTPPLCLITEVKPESADKVAITILSVRDEPEARTISYCVPFEHYTNAFEWKYGVPGRRMKFRSGCTAVFSSALEASSSASRRLSSPSNHTL